MEKNRKKLIHAHSSVFDKEPTRDFLEYGELAVNNSEWMSFISTKNSRDDVIRFSEDRVLMDWVERKTVFPYTAVIDNVDLEKNKSNIEFKMNQLVAKDTPKSKDVNHAKDIDGQDIEADGGFAIDMSRYAMIGANPSFKTISATTIYRVPSDNISGNTVDNALEEVYTRSKVTSREENNLLKFFQDGKEISSISLPVKKGEGKNSAVVIGDTQNANGEYSFAEGQNTIANNRSEHAMGEFNESHHLNNTFGSSGNTLFSIGNGTSATNRKNALEVMQNGDIYIYIKDANDVEQRICLNDLLTSLLFQTY